MGGLGIFKYTSLIPKDGSMKNVIYAVILDIIAVIAAFALTYMIGFEDDAPTAKLTKEEAKLAATGKKIAVSERVEDDIFSPLAGEVLPLSDAEDAAFSEGLLGQGLVILPTIGEIKAPFDGVVMTLFPTKHAIGLISDKGTELLIHIGIDTVELEGQHYKAFVTQGQAVKRGDKLITFDIAAIEAAGFNTQTPVIVTNSQILSKIEMTDQLKVSTADRLLTIDLANS